MIQLTDRVWVGNSTDQETVEFSARIAAATGTKKFIGAVLNVAHDLEGLVGWKNGIEYAQVGLIDGPGNPPAAYCAAILTLVTLLDRHAQVLVCDHDGVRSVVVAVVYAILKAGRVGERPSSPHYWRTWDSMVGELSESLGVKLPSPHPSHLEAVERVPYGLLERLI